MSKLRLDELPRRKQHSLVLGALVRPLASATALLVLYFVLPLDKGFSRATAVQLVLGLLAVAGLIGWQAWAIARAQYPRLRAIQALATSVPLYLLLFSTTYYVLENSRPGAFTEPMTRVDAIYFTVTVFATVGFGDIAPTSETARVLTTVQMLGNLVLVGIALRIILGAVRTGLRRQPGTLTEPPPD